jgi:hypothetical protein
MSYPPISPEAMALLRAFATSHGRTWKSVLRQQWMAAGALPLLHALRNTHGPSWLISFKLPKDEDHLLANVNQMAAKAEAKQVTPQVEALPGMAPLGLPQTKLTQLRDLTPGTIGVTAAGTWVKVLGFDAGRFKAQVDMVRKYDHAAIPGSCDARLAVKVATPSAEILGWFNTAAAARTADAQKRMSFKPGMRVEFDLQGKTITGTVQRVNTKSILITDDCGNGWRSTAAGLRPCTVAAPVALPEHPAMVRWTLGKVRYGLVGNEGRSWEQALLLDGLRVGTLRNDASGGPTDVDCPSQGHAAQFVADAKVWATAVRETPDGESFSLWAEWTTEDRPLGKAYQTLATRFGTEG